MILCAIYQTATGAIDQISHAVDLDSVSAVIGASQSVIGVDATVSDHTHYIASGVPVVMPAQPDPAFVWDWLTHAWTDPRTLAQRKATKWASMKAARNTAINAPLVTPHGTFDADPASRANIAGAVALAQTLAAAVPPFSITYTLADNTSVVLDGPGMVSVGLALGAQVQAAFATARALRVQIDAAATADAINLLNWPAIP